MCGVPHSFWHPWHRKDSTLCCLQVSQQVPWLIWDACSALERRLSTQHRFSFVGICLLLTAVGTWVLGHGADLPLELFLEGEPRGTRGAGISERDTERLREGSGGWAQHRLSTW